MAIRSRNYIKTNMKNFASDALTEDEDNDKDNVECDNMFHTAYNLDDDDDDNDDDKINDTNIYLQRQASHTSGSLDCSSAGSIPWAEDAIKLNQLEWKKIENLLSGHLKFNDASIEGDVDEALRKEILDWQKKFPELLTVNAKRKITRRVNTQEQLFTCNLSDSEDLSNISDDDDDDDEDDKDKDKVNPLLKCQEYKINSNNYKGYTKFSIRDEFHNEFKDQEKCAKENAVNPKDSEISELFNDFTLTSKRCNLNRREHCTNALPKLYNKNNNNNNNNNTNSHNNQNNGLMKFQSKKCQIKQQQHQTSNLTASCHSKRLRMPPIVNVLESARKFRQLGQLKQNQSFVQLTEIPQQAKSAVIRPNNIHDYNNLNVNYNDDNVTVLSQRHPHRNNKHNSAWLGHIQRIRNHCCFNNRNAIILPAIPTRSTNGHMHQYGLRNNNSNNNCNRNGQMLTNNQDNTLWPQENFSMNVIDEINRRRDTQMRSHPAHDEFDVALRIDLEYGNGRRVIRDQRATSTQTNSSSTSAGRSISALPITMSYNTAVTPSVVFSTYNNSSAHIANKYNAFKQL